MIVLSSFLDINSSCYPSVAFLKSVSIDLEGPYAERPLLLNASSSREQGSFYKARVLGSAAV